MKLTNKIMLVAGMLFQLSASLYADNWSDAFLAFGGGNDLALAAQNVLNNKGKSGKLAVLKMAVNTLGSSQEGMAVAAWLSNQPSSSFKTSYQAADVQAAAQDIISAAVRSVPVNNVPVSTGPVAAPAPAPSNGWNNWFGGSSASSSACPDNSAAIQEAVLAQQKADAAVAAANSQALAAIANSNASGASLYNAYIDLVFSSLQQAVAAIADKAVQQQVMQYIQNKLASMKASINANNYSSRVLGKYSSKKEPKKTKRSRAHATR